jgi:hypothetical protein
MVRTLTLMFLGSTAALFSQGSGSTAPPPPGADAGFAGSDRPFEVTRYVEGTLSSIDSEKRLIIVTDRKGKQAAFFLNDRTRWKADKKTELASKKKLELTDFRVGDPVRITYVASDDKAIELRLLFVKAKS